MEKLSKPFPVPIAPFLGELYITHFGEKELVLEMEIQERHLNPWKIVHGGVLFSLADTAAGCLPIMQGKKVVTLSSHISYLKAAGTGRIRAKAEARHRGQSTWMLRVDVMQGEVLLAEASFTFFVLGQVKKISLDSYR